MSMKLVSLCTFWFQEWARDKKIKVFKIQNSECLPYENRLLAIAQWFIVRLTQSLVSRSRIMLRHRLRNQNNKFHKFKMAEGRGQSMQTVDFSMTHHVKIYVLLSQAWFASDVPIKMTVNITLVISVTDNQ